ncbi:thiamine diphosphate-binding protein [Mariannaea sp. PMI_226]|nr:thiamine diphosphate-binding protein [Mariannaea sp. PMI_226]
MVMPISLVPDHLTVIHDKDGILQTRFTCFFSRASWKISIQMNFAAKRRATRWLKGNSRAFNGGYYVQIHHFERLNSVATTISNSEPPKFPGAMKSQLTDTMEFVSPASRPVIPTFNVMDFNSMIKTEHDDLKELDNETILTWYKNMVTLNTLDTIMSDAQRQGRISFYMASSGEEAVMIGSAAALDAGDVITCQYRETGVFMQRGFTLKDFMSQLFHNKNDPGKGRNMPCHYSGKLKVNAHAVASTLGTQIPHATGAAYALKLNAMEDPASKPQVGVVYFGDGAASEGDFHGALNLAATKDCPVIFICRNNGFAISTPTTEQYRGDGIACRGPSYGIDSLRVDGTDIFAVYAATKEARRRALEGGGRPILLEFMSYRISHHSTSDDSFAYRSRQDAEPWTQRDNPLKRLRKWLENKELWDETMEAQFRKQVRRDILRELEAGEKEKKPRISSVFDDVYAHLTEEAIAQKEELKRLILKYPGEYDVHEHEGGIEGL